MTELHNTFKRQNQLKNPMDMGLKKSPSDISAIHTQSTHNRWKDVIQQEELDCLKLATTHHFHKI
jgi:hypothetical protein